MEHFGYSPYFLYLLVFAGLPFAVIRPSKALIFVAFLISAANATGFTYTRTNLLGPYFNANDACLLIALIAVLSYELIQRKRLQFPKITRWIIVILLIGFVQSIINMGWTYEVLRSLRWAINLPLYFIIAATLIDDDRKVRYLLFALFFGSLISAVEHIIYVRSHLQNYIIAGFDIGQFRSIAFRSSGIWFLLAGIVWLPKIRGLNRPIILGAGILFAVSVVLNQTRSIWISSVFVLPVAFVLFQPKKVLKRISITPIIFAAIFAGLFLVLYFFNPKIDPFNIIFKRLGSIINENLRYESLVSRQLSFMREIEEWRQGWFIIGRGLSYFTPYIRSVQDLHEIAWGHLGHVTTLAQLGLIGLLFYSYYLPKNVIRSSRMIWVRRAKEVKFLGLISGICIIWLWICFFMSDSFLGPHATAGIIFGATWRQAKLLKSRRV